MKRLFTSALTSLALLASTPLSALTVDVNGVLVFEEGDEKGKEYMLNAGLGYGVIHNMVNRCEGMEKAIPIYGSVINFNYPIEGVQDSLLRAEISAEVQGIDKENFSQYVFSEAMLEGESLAEVFECSNDKVYLIVSELDFTMKSLRAWVLENMNTRN